MTALSRSKTALIATVFSCVLFSGSLGYTQDLESTFDFSQEQQIADTHESGPSLSELEEQRKEYIQPLKENIVVPALPDDVTSLSSLNVPEIAGLEELEQFKASQEGSVRVVEESEMTHITNTSETSLTDTTTSLAFKRICTAIATLCILGGLSFLGSRKLKSSTQTSEDPILASIRDVAHNSK